MNEGLPDTQIELPPPPPPVRPWLGCLGGSLFAFLALLTLVLMGIAAFSERSFQEIPLVLFPIFLGVLGIGIYLINAAYKAHRGSPRIPIVRFYNTYFSLPGTLGSKKILSLRYGDILTANVARRGGTGILVVATESRKVLYAGRDRREYRQCCEEIYRRMAAMPNGQALLARLNHSHEMTRRVMAKKPILTRAFLVVILGVFGVEYWLGALEDPFGLIFLGANVPALVSNGEWFRLISGNFLHAGLLHIYLNSIALLSIGSVLEKLIGGPRFLLVYLASALMGALASLLFVPSLASVGASTAIFGILGALLVLHIRFFGSIPSLFRLSKKWWLIVLGINFSLPLFVPIIDAAGHAGGFLAGVVVTYLIYRTPKKYSLSIPIPPLAVAGGALLGLLFLGGILAALVNAGDAELTHRTRLMQALVEHGRRDPSLLNTLAWDAVTDPHATEEQLSIALSAVQASVDEEPQESAFLDTLATAHYRLQSYDRAIELERQALRLRYDDDSLPTQLARFLYARKEAAGPILQGDVAAQDVRFLTAPEGCQLEVTTRFEQGLDLYALILDDHRLKGLLYCATGEMRADADLYVYDLFGGESGYCVPHQMEVVLIDAREEAGRRSDPAWHYWPAEPRILALP
ncbi:MAG: rhomboid family intramembrane serine protease [bacterium]|nr:rhomboid family intramembrane serine protease [bacterium]